MKNILLILLIPLMSFSQAKDSATVKDSIERVVILKKINEKQTNINKSLKEYKKLDKEVNTLLKKLVTFYKKMIAERTKTKEPDLSDLNAIKPQEYEPIEEPKESIEQKPRSKIIMWLKSIFTKTKTDETDIISD